MAYDDDIGFLYGNAPANTLIIPTGIFSSFGSYGFTVVVGGTYTIRVWGAGGSGHSSNGTDFPNSAGGSAGGFTKKKIILSKGVVIPVSINGSGVATVTLTGTTLQATNGIRGTASSNPTVSGGVGSGGDVNLNGGSLLSAVPQSGDGLFAGSVGSNSGPAFGGASAPGDEYLTGGKGGNGFISTSAPSANTPSYGGFPGGGGGGNYDNNAGYGGFNFPGGAALVLFCFESS